MQPDTHQKFSTTTLALHWIVGLTLITLLAVGVYMEENEAYALYPWHKSFGITIFFFAVWRIIWRIRNGWPAPAGDHLKIEHLLARAIHWLLIIGTVLMPASGFLMSSLGGNGVEWFGLELVARNPDPDNPMQTVPYNEFLAGLFHRTHHLAGEAMIIAVVLHALGALKHHMIDRDGTLRRMLGGRLA